MFKSARVKLTLFYLTILLIFSLMLTLGTRALAEREYDNSNTAERGAVRDLFLHLYSIPPRPDSSFVNVQQNQAELVRQHLNDDVILINLAALVIGGLLSYWYAGRALRPIEEAHESQKRFASDASHELRTPLANLRLENEVFLRQKTFKPAEAKNLIQSNLEEVQRLESLAGNLLSLTQYEQAQLPLEPCDIKTILSQALHRVDRLAKAKATQFEQHVEGAKIVGHAESLEQLLVIVLDNAIKYGPAESTVAIAGEPRDGRYNLQVRDNGLGIDGTDLPHIFERLYRGDKARTGGSGGYGLGLALAAEIARANRASLTAANAAAGSGAVFTLSLPLAGK